MNYFSFKFIVRVSIDTDFNKITDNYIPEFCFFEVRGNPDIIEIIDRENGLTGLDNFVIPKNRDLKFGTSEFRTDKEIDKIKE